MDPDLDPGPRTWSQTRTLDPEPQTQTLKTWTLKTWTLKNLDPEKPGP